MSETDFPFDSTWCFSVSAAREAGVMLRVLELFAKRGLVPASIHAGAGDDGRDSLAVDLQVNDLTEEAAARIAASLCALVSVDRVLVSAKRAVLAKAVR
jgi:acetolactate synthase small subunit